MTAQLRVRVWVDGEVTDERLIDHENMQSEAERDAEHWLAIRESGGRCRVVVDDPDDPGGEPWMDAREDGVVLVYGRSVSLDGES